MNEKILMKFLSDINLNKSNRSNDEMVNKIGKHLIEIIVNVAFYWFSFVYILIHIFPEKSKVKITNNMFYNSKYKSQIL